MASNKLLVRRFVVKLEVNRFRFECVIISVGEYFNQRESFLLYFKV